jgi:monoamine oxidase
MTEYINGSNLGSIKFDSRVTGLSYDAAADRASRMNVSIYERQDRKYSHVISTAPLTCLRTMDLDSSGLSPKQTNALRALQYSPSVKVGIKFKTAWWTTGIDLDGKKIDITGGQSFSDLPIRTVVYPSYGVGTDHPTSVLIASYTWTEDARRLGALIDQGTTADNQLKKLVLRDLALIHNVSVEYLEGEYVAHFAWDWSHSPLTMGKFMLYRSLENLSSPI